MIIGKYIRMLLDERKRVILPGFGNLEVFVPEGTQTPSGKRINPPGTSIKFDTSFSKDDDVLAETMAAGEVLERDEAQQRVLELVDAVKFSLDKGEDFVLPEAGTFTKDADGKILFQADPAWVLEPDQYGLESMDLLELEELPIEDEKAQESGTESKAMPKVTTLAPPKAKPKSKKWRVIWLVAAVLIIVLAVLIIIPSEEGENGERKGLFSKKADQEVVDPQTEVDEQVTPPETEQVESEPEAEQSLPVEETNSFFIIAGSFNKLKNASDLQDKLNNRGFQAEVMITENRMYRVSVASYATKAEAEKELAKIKSQSGLQSCWLLSN
jgi:cell division protein FtsN/nucleoid DNA-binding protein